MTSPTDSADLLPADPECMGHDVDAVMSDCPSSSASRSHSYCCDPPTRLQPVLLVCMTTCLRQDHASHAGRHSRQRPLQDEGPV
ncbi:unnamed protein product (mitochondrion) [Plasmodiophora brassicae]|uniref:Uncharacterized protein n=1 Tax=Plasmodiophora brassicae TaxID=37360 RepID=A0A3P3YGX1_PLABS|nr:unnamed protein product [Plasmodiophora brassicae]